MPHFCSCLLAFGDDEDGTIKQDGPVVNKLMEVFENYAENLLKPVAHLCKKITPRNAFLMKRLSSHYFQLSFYTYPGRAQWEVTFKVLLDGSVISKAQVADHSQVSRTNSYGKASHCVAADFPHLREYCICNDFIY